jgi:hypothetical protein
MKHLLTKERPSFLSAWQCFTLSLSNKVADSAQYLFWISQCMVFTALVGVVVVELKQSPNQTHVFRTPEYSDRRENAISSILGWVPCQSTPMGFL